MELKEQIEQLEKDFNYRIQELKNQINKPKIEVGKVYKSKVVGYEKILMCITELDNDGWCVAYGIDVYGDYFKGRSCHQDKQLIEATPEEWTTALTKYADELYKDCDRVDRSGLDIPKEYEAIKIDSLERNHSAYLMDDGFWYKGRYVMDKHGKWAKGLKAEVKDYDIEVVNNTDVNFHINKSFENGKYKLVPVD